MSEIKKQSDVEASAGAKAEIKAKLYKELEFRKGEAQEALNRNDYGALLGSVQHLINLERQLQHWEHQD
jgi:hypothetical protein